ncbi:MAG: hypothetical protein ACI9OJ_003717 [Myxococcota bacterium]|jgi:hypothetical protein
MTERTRNEPLSLDPDFAAGVKSVLDAANYDEEHIRAHLTGDSEGVPFSSETFPRMLRATSNGSTLETFLRLLAFSVPVSAAELAAAIVPMNIDSWVRGGIVRIDGDSVIPRVCISPELGLRLAFDVIRPGEARPDDFVMGIAKSSMVLVNCAVTRPVGRLLDLGTGCGGTALVQARRAESVVATDLSERAVGFARFNVLLNDVSNVECRAGSLLEPVAGDTFDHITMNAPYAITPTKRFTYRDGGEELVQEMLSQGAGALNPGGLLQVVCQWAHVDGQSPTERLAGWVKGLGCDGWVIRTASLKTAGYAESWINGTENHDAASYRKRFDEWVDWFEAEGITGVSTGIINLRKTTSGRDGWFEVSQEDVTIDAEAGSAIEAGLLARDLFAAAAANSKLIEDHAFLVADGVKLEQVLQSDGDAWAPETVRLLTTRGICGSVNVDARVAHLVARSNGQRTFGSLIAEVAASLGRDPRDLTGPLTVVARLLATRGILRLNSP